MARPVLYLSSVSCYVFVAGLEAERERDISALLNRLMPMSMQLNAVYPDVTYMH